MHRFITISLFILFQLSIVVYANNRCDTFLKPTEIAAYLNNHKDQTLLTDKLSEFKNVDEFLLKIEEQLRTTQVRLNTSRSTHKATEDFPRLIFIDEKDPKQILIYAFSMRPAQEPVLEIQSFDTNNKKTALYQVAWDQTGKVRLNKNPRRCFGCHSGGRPLLTSLPSERAWPFVFAQDMKNAEALEAKLSELNNIIQFQHLNDIKIDPRLHDLLKSAFNDDAKTFERKFAKARSKHRPEDIELFFIHQRGIFLHFSGLNKQLHSGNLTPQEQLVLRLLQVFQLADLAGFLDLLSINLRPNNYELSTESFNALKSWVDNLDHQPQLQNKKKWFWW